MTQVKALTVVQLRRVLRSYGLQESGLKETLIARVEEYLGAEVIDSVILQDILNDQSGVMQQQIDALKELMITVSNSVNEIRNSVNEQTNLANQSMNQTVIPSDGSSPTSHEGVHVPNNALSESIRNAEIRETNAELGVKPNLRDFVAMLPEFDPIKAELSAQQFLDKVNNLAHAYEWSEKIKLYAAQMRLRGHAKAWVDAHDVFKSWTEFVNELVINFPREINVADIHIKLGKSHQTRGETMLDFYYKMLAIGLKGKLDDAAIIRHIINGLYDDNIRRTFNSLHFGKCTELLKAITGMPEHQTNVLPKHTGFQFKTTYNNENKPGFAKKDIKVITCYNCNEVGHISKNCTKPPKRNRCPSCDKVHAIGEPADCGKKAVKSRRLNVGDHIFLKKIYIDDTEWVAFVDTGSQCSMVRRIVADKISQVRQPCLLTIRGIGGGTKCATEKVQVKLTIDDVSIQLDLYVVDDDVIDEDLLLGQDIFNNHEIQAVVENGKMMFRVARVEIHDNKLIDPKCDNLKENDYNRLANLLNEYSDRFAIDLQDIGKTDLVTLKIQLDTDVPIAQPPYRVPYPKRIIISEMVDKLLQNDIIQVSESAYASPITLVKKPDGSDRFCVDYRKLNQHMCKEVYPMPNIEERLQDAKQYRIFTSLDLNSGYYQIAVEESSRCYTAFVTTEGLYEFKRMPFGLRNAPMAFQRLMAKVKDMLQPTDIIHYMDDILIGANSNDEMFDRMQRVLVALRKAGLTLNPKKCSFFTESITFLGHKLTAAGIEPGEIKTRAITNFKTPTTVTEIRRFLGLSGYFRKFVPGYALISEPLRKLLKKDEPFVWTVHQENAFQELKEKLTTTPVLVAYDVKADHQLHTDASSIGLAAVLMQRTNEEWKPVAYFSRSTSPSEVKFHSYELETLAVVEGLERFRYYVYGKLITVVTDCSAVAATLTKRELIPRIARWWLKIQDYSLNMEHRAETRMCHVDALSRMPDEAPKTMEVATLRMDRADISEKDWLMSMQLQDDEIQKNIVNIRNGDKQAKKEYVVENGRLLKLLDGNKLYVVPKLLRYKIVMDAHVNGGHLSIDRTIDRIQRLMWFPRMRNFIKSCLKSCIDCAYNKNVSGKSEGEYHYSEVSGIPFKLIHIDHLGPFPRSSKRNEHIVVAVDAFTKYTCVKAVPSTATKYVIKFLDEISTWVGLPERIVSDRGTAFTSKEFTRYCDDHCIKHVLNAVRTPRANGQVERMNRTIMSMLLPLTEKSKKWDDGLRQIQWSINIALNATTQQSPHELLFGFKPKDILANKLVWVLHDLTDDLSAEDDRLTTLATTRENAVLQIENTRIKAKERFDKQHTTPRKYECNDLVLVTNEASSTGLSRKLEPKYKGPFIVTKVLGNDRYVVEDLPGTERCQRHYTSVYASDAMKSWCTLPPDSFVDESEFSEDAEEVDGRL